MMESTSRYVDASREYMGKAYHYLAENDLPQAGEKAWGAAAEMVKAVAEERGRFHRSHRVLYEIVDDLTEETGDADLGRAFDVASHLHYNYYERWLPRRTVQRGVADVQRFVDKLEPLADTP